MSSSLSPERIDEWTTKTDVVALHLEQQLLPVEGRGAVFFPPTFADIGYNIDTLQDGTQVALVDSAGSQANRMEPIFLREELENLVPKVTITYGDTKKETDGAISLLEAGHRLGDAVVRGTELHEEARAAFHALLRKQDAGPLAKLAPTSLIFGVWDSRDTMAKVPRLLQSTIRAWDVSKLTRSAQYTPSLNYAALDVFSESEKEKAEKKSSDQLAERGYVHVPASGSHGGIIANGPIRRDVTLNLVQLRRLEAGEQTKAMRKYLLGLALVAGAEPCDAFLRQGCLLVPDPETPAKWQAVHRDGSRENVELTPGVAVEYAQAQAKAFGVAPPREVSFDKGRAKKDAKAKTK